MKKCFLGLISLVLLSIGCTSTNPTSTITPTFTPQTTPFPVMYPSAGFPGVVIGFSSQADEYTLVSREICFTMDGSAFWEMAGAWTDDDVPMTVTIDGQTVTEFRYMWIGASNVARNDQGTPIGSYPTNFDYCFTPNIEIGTHHIQVEITGMSGEVYSSSWDFVSE
jgi:hypothetical protein